jgi:hypothetical protein
MQENIARMKKAMQPASRLFGTLHSVMAWENPILSLIVLVGYMSLAWQGRLLISAASVLTVMFLWNAFISDEKRMFGYAPRIVETVCQVTGVPARIG